MDRLVLPDYIGAPQPVRPSAASGEGEIFAPRWADGDSPLVPMRP